MAAAHAICLLHLASGGWDAAGWAGLGRIARILRVLAQVTLQVTVQVCVCVRMCLDELTEGHHV